MQWTDCGNRVHVRVRLAGRSAPADGPRQLRAAANTPLACNTDYVWLCTLDLFCCIDSMCSIDVSMLCVHLTLSSPRIQTCDISHIAYIESTLCAHSVLGKDALLAQVARPEKNPEKPLGCSRSKTCRGQRHEIRSGLRPETALLLALTCNCLAGASGGVGDSPTTRRLTVALLMMRSGAAHRRGQARATPPCTHACMSILQ